MRVVNWDTKAADKMVATGSMKRLRKAAKIVAEKTRHNCPVGTLTRPMYKKGPYAGQAWTARDGGQLKESIRVVERNIEKYGFALAAGGNIRIYAGHYLAYYARIVEHSRPFMRPAIEATKQQVKSIMENG